MFTVTVSADMHQLIKIQCLILCRSPSCCTMDSVTFLQHVLMRFCKVNSALSCCAKPLTLVDGVAMIEWLGWKEYYFSVIQNDIHII